MHRQFRTLSFLLILFFAVFIAARCHPAHQVSPTAIKPEPRIPTALAQRTDPVRVDTAPKAPVEPAEKAPSRAVRPERAGPFRVVVLLPFLTDQFVEEIPEKSQLALQFYAGVRMASERLSRSGGPDIQLDVVDTQLSDQEFRFAMQHPLLLDAEVIIGPVRPTHVSLLAPQAIARRQIVVSPESPNSNLVSRFPDFVQTNPGLRAHCEAVLNHATARYAGDQMVLVCKAREADRLAYFQDVRRRNGEKLLRELILPDQSNNLAGVDLRAGIPAGKRAVYLVPSWSSQDFVNALLGKIRADKIDATVYGMPQWADFEQIDPEYLSGCRVHIPKASHVNYDRTEVRGFQQQFYEQYATIPNEYAFNGYDVTLFVGQMLKQWGLSFPEKLDQSPYQGLRSTFQFRSAPAERPVDAGEPSIDYRENTFVHILRFDRYGFVPDQR
jgi:hypothetical protein